MGKQRIITEEERQKVIYNYTVLKMSQKNSGKEFGMSDKIVTKILTEANIHIRSGSEARMKYHVDETVFEVDNQTSNSAYILGMLSSDGCIASKENQIYIELQREDREVLEKINLAIKNERPVKDYETATGYKNSKLYFYSQKIKNDLAKFHVIPNKTYNQDFKFPELLKKEFYWDYIRGLFDGDGSIKLTNTTITWQIDISSYDIAKNIQKFLLEEGIKVQVSTLPKKNIDCYRVYAYTQEKCKAIFQNMYQNPNCIYLARKFEKFKTLMK